MVFNRIPLLVLVLLSLCPCKAEHGMRPEKVNVGALLPYNTTIGRVAKNAIELALEDVNNDPNVLNGTKLVLTMMDSNCSAFIGTSAALDLTKHNVVAIIGPQSSVIAHVISHIAYGLQVPLVSFGATDPSLSPLQYPYFLRFTHGDFSVMTAIVAVIANFVWREVVAVYIDDDYGRNGITALSDALGNKANIVQKYPISPRITRSGIDSKLKDMALLTTRVFVVHMNPDAGIKFLAEANRLGMLTTGYVWIATDWLSSYLDSLMLNSDRMNSLQGVITLRRHIPDSQQKHNFSVRWTNLQRDGLVDAGLNVFGLYAYDAVWATAYAIDAYLDKRGNISFVDYPEFSNASGSGSEIAELKVFEGGPQLRTMLLQTNFTGLTGPVKLDTGGGLLGATFEIINIVESALHKVSYWSSKSGLSVILPESRGESSHNKTSLAEKFFNIMWPGDSKKVPRGWTIPNNGKRFRIAVPRKRGGFEKFVKIGEGSHEVSGYCIDVFNAAVHLLPYTLPYEFIAYGNQNQSTVYDELVQQVNSKKYDAAVGDISTTTNRSKMVDFTQPYVNSGLAVVVPVEKMNSNPWAFLRPFTLEMWCTTGLFFLVIGAVVWILEHKLNPDFRGQPKKQILTVFWFSFSTMFFSHRENIMSSLGKIVLVIWLFVVLIIQSSYTASLTSILTVQQLSPTIKGIDDLISSNVQIGYQTGSFVRNYLVEELNIAQSRLIPLDSPEFFFKALSEGPNKGGVAAIVDDLPDIQLFLSTYCGFVMVGQTFTKGGWGFIFQKESPLQVDVTTAILNLSESGELQKIHNRWLSKDICTSQKNQNGPNKLSLKDFWGLFLVCGLAAFAALLGHICRLALQFRRHPITDDELPGGRSFLRKFLSFADQREINHRNERSNRQQSEEQGETNQISS